MLDYLGRDRNNIEKVRLEKSRSDSMKNDAGSVSAHPYSSSCYGQGEAVVSCKALALQQLLSLCLLDAEDRCCCSLLAGTVDIRSHARRSATPASGMGSAHPVQACANVSAKSAGKRASWIRPQPEKAVEFATRWHRHQTGRTRNEQKESTDSRGKPPPVDPANVSPFLPLVTRERNFLVTNLRQALHSRNPVRSRRTAARTTTKSSGARLRAWKRSARSRCTDRGRSTRPAATRASDRRGDGEKEEWFV